MTSPEESLLSDADYCHTCAKKFLGLSFCRPVTLQLLRPLEGKVLLIKQQSKNKPLSGSLSCVYEATNPHLLGKVKTLCGLCVQ